MGFCFDRRILLLLTLTDITQSVTKLMMLRPLKTLQYHLKLCAHKSYVYCGLARLTGAFKKHVDLVPCIIGSDYKDIKLYVLDPFHLRMANKLSKLYQSIYSHDHPRR